MQKLVLYINSERLDLFKDETVSLTQTIQNVKDIKKIFTEFTQTFSVPASKINNKIFKHYYNFNISGGYDARIKQNATLELNDLPFKIGKITLNGVDLKNNLAHTYRITFFGNTVDLKDILSNSQLSSLSSLATYNQIYSFNKVKAAIQNFASGSNDNIIVPLITHTDRMVYNSTNNVDTNVYGNVYYNANIDFENNGINWNQFKYAIRVQAIIAAIQTQYEITFSNDFFNDVNNLTFHNLFLWLHRKKGSVEGISQIDENFTQLNQLNNTSCTPPATCNNLISTATNGILELHAPSPYRIIGTTLQINPPIGGNNYSVRIIRNGSEIVASNTNASSTVNFTELLENDSTYSVEIASTGGITFAANSIIWVVTWDVPGGTGAGSAGSLTYKNPQTFTTTSDFDFDINSQIPKMPIIEFLTGLFQMFNLTAYVDETGTIVVRTLDSYYASNVKPAINIDQYLDVTKSVIDVALPFNKVNFGYKGLGTFLAKQYEQLFNAAWGSESYTLDGDIFDAPSTPYSIELPFEHLMYERLYNVNGATSTTIQWGYFVDDNQESYFGSPLLFYPIRQTTGTTPIALRNTNPIEQFSITSYFIPSNALALLPTTSKVNIHFRAMINEYLANEDGDTANDFTDTLFKTNYETYIQEVFNLQKRLTKVTAFLPYKIFSSLELNNIIQLGQDNYKINSLKTNLTNGKTEFELLNTIQ